MKDNEKLRLWQGRFTRNESRFADEREKMNKREALYRGDNAIEALTRDDKAEKTPHIRNICNEIIESQVSSEIPKPKVTARREKDEELASIIEDMIRNEMDRMPFEMINDAIERMTPIHGGCGMLVEWDNTKRTHTTIGELEISAIHPCQIIPQAGVYSGVEDMDYIFLLVPQTKEYITARYGVDVSRESEDKPEAKGGSGSTEDDMVTQKVAYYRNKSGGIGVFSWVNDVILEDMDDYQARRRRRCKMCGAPEPSEDVKPMETPTEDGNVELPEGETEEPKNKAWSGKRVCPYCGASKWEEASEEYEEMFVDGVRSDGSIVPAMTAVADGMGLPIPETMQRTKIPYYKPDIYPILLRKNVSVFGQFLGSSDIDLIASQQNTTNRIEKKIIDKLVQSGSYITLPDAAKIKTDSEDMKVIRPGNQADKEMIDVFDLEGNVSQDLTYLAQVYEEARQEIGITDSFQGRTDSTATSGKAKEFAAAQSAGRLESKRRMKDAAFANLFEAMFKFKLAYTDEARPVIRENQKGEREYKTFNRFDFLEQDDAGEWYWNDQFLFGVDSNRPLAENREAMWQETNGYFQAGAFGNPTETETQILFWKRMAELHYPGAEQTKATLQEKMERQAQQQQAMMAMQQRQAQMEARQTPPKQTGSGGAGLDRMTAQSVIEQARQDAMRDAGRRA